MSTVSSSASKHSSRRHSTNSIESSVTRLLVSTKHLLESLTQWARNEVDDKYVSDAYVKLGNDFRAASRAFTHAGIDISDIGDVPQALRVILESALSETPSQENLDRFLPNIRNIIVTLLQSLKSKQNKAKLISQPVASPSGARESIKVEKRQKSLDTFSEDEKRYLHSRSLSLTLPPSQPPPQAVAAASTPRIEKKVSKESITERDALAQLQNENFLQRRASKRFSAYQYAKLANINPTNALPSVGPEARRDVSAQSVKESMRNKFAASSTSITAVESDNENTYIFLRIDNQTKKVPVKMPVSFASLRLLFVEKFAYTPGATDFPAICVVDNKTGVSYELEDQYLQDVTTGTLLCLNENKPEDKTETAVSDTSILSANQQQKSIADDQSFKELEAVVSELKSKFDLFDQLIVNTIKESISAIELPSVQAPPAAPTTPISSDKKDLDKSDVSSDSSAYTTPPPLKPKISPELVKEVSSIENELRVIRQLQNANKSAVLSFVSDVDSKIKQLQEAGVDTANAEGRIYMEKCHAKLSEESDSLLTKVDDLQDVMEALRKDVAQRGVRVGPQQLKSTMKDITEADTALKNMAEYIMKEKGVWKKIWETELDKVCEEQQFFNLQDDLTKDLEEDLAKIRETFDLVEQCSLEQSKLSAHRRNKVVANLPIPEPGENIHNIKDAVLNEVALLKPDHESRVDAINRAEKLREKNRQMMNMTEFQEELGNFVDDSKLRKSGGVGEIERQRQLKDSENLKSSMSGIP